MALEKTVVDSQYESFSTLLKFLSENNELTHAQVFSDAVRRNLVISAASFFEQLIKEAVADFPRHRGGGHPAIISLVRKGLVDRGYHAMFDWESGNPNKFFSYFGEEFGGQMKKACREDAALKASANSFISLGSLRNTLVHSNFALLTFDTSLDEVYDLYKRSKQFVDFLILRLGPEL